MIAFLSVDLLAFVPCICSLHHLIPCNTTTALYLDRLYLSLCKPSIPSSKCQLSPCLRLLQGDSQGPHRNNTSSAHHPALAARSKPRLPVAHLRSQHQAGNDLEMTPTWMPKTPLCLLVPSLDCDFRRPTSVTAEATASISTVPPHHATWPTSSPTKTPTRTSHSPPKNLHRAPSSTHTASRKLIGAHLFLLIGPRRLTASERCHAQISQRHRKVLECLRPCQSALAIRCGVDPAETEAASPLPTRQSPSSAVTTSRLSDANPNVPPSNSSCNRHSVCFLMHRRKQEA